MRGTPRIAGLDNLRALAIVLVLLVHYLIYHKPPNWVAPLAATGWTGVDLFFVLSGFLIGHMLMKEVQASDKIDLTRFYINRALRILPLYYFVLGVYFIFPGLHEKSSGGLQPLWRYVTFTQNLPGQLNTTFSHSWSLSVEEHFYILFPILLLGVARLLRRTPRSTESPASASHKTGVKVVLIFLFILFLGLLTKYLTWSALVDPLLGRSRAFSYFEWMYYPSFNRFDGLFFGVVIAVVKAYKPHWAAPIRKFRYLFFGLGLATLVVALWMTGVVPVSPQASELPSSVLLYTMVGLGYAFFVLPAAHGKPSNSFLAKPTRYLAVWSYSIYLTHKMSYEFVDAQVVELVELGATTTMVVSIVFAVAVGAAVYYAVERPFMILKSSLKMNRPAAPESDRELVTVSD